VRVDVHVRPRSSRSGITGTHDGALEVALAAPPVDGAANAELVSLLAQVFAVKRRDVSVVAGATGRRKIVEIRGLDVATASARVVAGLRG
jgi:uncharacterized protein (TIGR00251 family)